MISIYGNENLINNRDFRNPGGQTNYLYQLVDAVFTYFLFGCTASRTISEICSMPINRVRDISKMDAMFNWTGII